MDVSGQPAAEVSHLGPLQRPVGATNAKSLAAIYNVHAPYTSNVPAHASGADHPDSEAQQFHPPWNADNETLKTIKELVAGVRREGSWLAFRLAEQKASGEAAMVQAEVPLHSRERFNILGR